MGQRNTPGLRKRGDVWHIEKTVKGVRLFESTGESDREKAETYLLKRIEEVRQVKVYGQREKRDFSQTAARYLQENVDKRSILRDAESLKVVMPYIGTLELTQLHAGSLAEFISDRQANGLAAGTINRDMAIIRRILKLAATMWRDDRGRPWIDSAPMLPLVKGCKRKPRPIT